MVWVSPHATRDSMGCSFSRLVRRDADNNPRVFRVFNVDEQAQELSTGKIEITDTDLILYPKSKEPLRWPLRSLRRYGFDAELFSFESGRRCPTGPGIYAFKCRRAEALFNLLQECIQRAGQEDQQQRHIVSDNPSRPNSLIEIQTPNGSAPSPGPVLGSAASTMAFNLPPSVHSGHQYVNGYVASSPDTGVSPSRHSLPFVNPSPRPHEYVNTEIAVGAVGPNSTRGSRQSLDITAIQVKMQRTSPSHSEGHIINYAELDLPKSMEELIHSNDGAGAVCPAAPVHVVELDPSSSQATYINVQGSDTEAVLPFKRTLASPNGASGWGPAAAAGVERAGERAERVGGGGGGGGGMGAARKVFMRQMSKEDPHSYANLDLLSTNTHRGARKVTYIQVDVKSSKENLYNGSNPPASPISLTASIPDSPRRTESYAQIDFHKTAALSKCANSEDEGSRKTRHNSNIEELN